MNVGQRDEFVAMCKANERRELAEKASTVRRVRGPEYSSGKPRTRGPLGDSPEVQLSNSKGDSIRTTASYGS